MANIDLFPKAVSLLTRICKEFRSHDQENMLGADGEREHALEVLRWVEILNPEASIPLKIAALFHDIDRMINPEMGGGFEGKRNSKEYFLHKKMHSQRSAEYVGKVLKRWKIKRDIIERVEFLILHHDDLAKESTEKKDAELDCLITADTLAFFTTVADKMWQIEGKVRTEDKMRFMIEKLSGNARKVLFNCNLDNPLFNDLKNRILNTISHKKKNRKDDSNP